MVRTGTWHAPSTKMCLAPNKNGISSVQSLGRVRLFATPWIAACQASLSIIQLPESLPPTPPSIRVFSNESTLRMRWPKYWSFSFSIIPSKEHPGLISFKMDWLDLLAVQGTLKSLLQHHSSKASILRCGTECLKYLGFPSWYSGQELACQCRGWGFNPWSGKIPRAVEQLSPGATTTEPAL